jgi:hypothetical protein
MIIPSQYNGYSPDGRRVYNFDGGDSPPPQPTQTSQITIPEYAQPYMERLLGKTEALTDSPYQTYGGQRMATSTPEQLAARGSVAGMTVPGQFDVGTGIAGAAGLGSLTAGQDYMRMATSPQFQQAFMSPYMQNVVDMQKAAAIRDAQKVQLASNLGAARQGTFGGARQLIATTERERALGGQLADIQAKGLQSAYDQAIKSMQFGTETGLRGYGQGIQAAQTLGQLGAAEQTAGLDLARAQETFGGLGQAEQQRALDLAYQDFLNQQQYPYKQLGFMSDILRGSANLAGTGGKAVYEAPPSQLSQIVGPGLLGLGIYREFMKS